MALRVQTAPASEPVTLPEMKLFLKVDGTADDALITALIQAAREYGEVYTKRSFFTTIWELTLDGFPSKGIELPRPPLASVTSITYYDENGDSQVITPTDYFVDTKSEPGWVLPAFGLNWPTARDQANAVTIVYTSGFADVGDIPESIKTWLKVRVATLYENRQAVVTGLAVAPMPRTFVDGLLDPYKVPYL